MASPRTTDEAPTRSEKPLNPLDRFFHITERGSTIGTEIRGGLVTFFTMAYIIVLNPIILGGKDATGQALAAPATIAATTALVAGVMTILMGVWANFPLALATGLGINAVVAFSIAVLPKMAWQDAMGIVVLEGIIITVLVLTGFRQAVFNAVPTWLKTAISVGIGLFIAFIGVVDSGFVRVPPGAATPVELGQFGSLSTWPVLVFVIGLVLMVILLVKKVRGAILISILGTTVLGIVVEAVAKLGFGTDKNPGGWKSTVPSFPKTIVDAPNFSLLGHFSLFGAFTKIGAITAIVLVFSLLLSDFFDTMGTMVAIGAEAGLNDENGNPPKTREILIVDSLAAVAGGMGGVSSNTAYIESASGVGDGARTGLASIVTGVAFLLSTFLAPLVAVIPSEAAAPALVVVGFLMVTQVLDIDWKSFEIAIPAFFTMILMPFTYSITAGIGAGVIMYVILQAVVGKARKIHPLMWLITVLFVLYFIRGPLQTWIG
ncbi:MAG: permease [Cellulomonas sp. 73-145]|uniref:NCS2 family permease n=1 Tax=Cellulomonas sp. 73-145 TaxID=1895739 RepID=UPI00092B8C8F|nr:NCS2 family permease [Cellulomonas sp. 73-145]MBN9327509.1 NCS2 family permease [Cellulomonas sp.]OJV57167.1 MAG: permease [Cellulomonas sp. 73-145]